MFGGHGEQDADPAEELVPALHSLHSEEPISAHLPAGQILHSLDPALL